MTAATAIRSAYPPAIADLMPRAIELTKTLDGDLPSRNRLMKGLHIGSDKAKAVLAELAAIAERDQHVTDLHTAMVARGSLAERPSLTLVPDVPAKAAPPELTPERLRELSQIARAADNPALTVERLAELDGLARSAGIDWKPEALRDFAMGLKTEPIPDPVVAPAETESPAAVADTVRSVVDQHLAAGHQIVVTDDKTEMARLLNTGDPQAEPTTEPPPRPVTWPVLILCLPAFVAIWGGWVEMGRLTGFGKVTLLPGILDHFQLNTAITLPIGVETYAAYALYAWLSGRAAGDARTFAKRSAIASLAVGALGQIAYHLMAAWGWASAPWPITAFVACLPVAVLGMGAALAHLMHKH
jgi:hypothetical protein